MFKNFSTKEIILYIFAYLALIITYIIFKSGIIEFLVSVFLLSGIVLNIKGNRLCFLFSGIGGLIYSYIAYNNSLYSEVIINIFYMTPTLIWGYFKWKKDKDNKIKLQIKSLKFKHLLYISLFIIALTLGYGYFLLKINNAMSFISAFATACSVLGVTFAANKIKQQFVFWILNNLSLVILWFYTLNQSTIQLPILILNLIFIALNLRGLVNWNTMYRNQK